MGEVTPHQRWLDTRVESRPDVLGGEPCFRGTRLPVKTIGELAMNHSAARIASTPAVHLASLTIIWRFCASVDEWRT